MGIKNQIPGSGFRGDFADSQSPIFASAGPSILSVDRNRRWRLEANEVYGTKVGRIRKVAGIVDQNRRARR
jgi:hypothetical protein